jgi:hypothetical protein
LDKKRTQATIGFIHNRVFGTDAFYPYQKHGWRAQRAGLGQLDASALGGA